MEADRFVAVKKVKVGGTEYLPKQELSRDALDALPAANLNALINSRFVRRMTAEELAGTSAQGASHIKVKGNSSPSASATVTTAGKSKRNKKGNRVRLS